MDVPTIHIDVSNNALGYKIIKLHGPTKSDWDCFFNNPKKTNMFLSNRSPHAIMGMISGILTVHTGKERFTLFPDMIIDSEEYNTIMDTITTITKNAVKLKSMRDS